MSLSLPTEILDDVIYKALCFAQDLQIGIDAVKYDYKIAPRTIPGTYAVKLRFQITENSCLILNLSYSLNGENTWHCSSKRFYKFK